MTNDPKAINKALVAWQAYNYKIKHGRITSFDLERWLKVVQAVDDGHLTLRKNGKIKYAVSTAKPYALWTEDMKQAHREKVRASARKRKEKRVS